jgi:hypothetical protein
MTRQARPSTRRRTAPQPQCLVRGDALAPALPWSAEQASRELILELLDGEHGELGLKAVWAGANPGEGDRELRLAHQHQLKRHAC